MPWGQTFRRSSVALVVGSTFLLGASGGAVASSLLTTKPAPKIAGVVGAVNRDCTQEIVSNRYSVAGSADTCTLTFPKTEFASTPVAVITPQKAVSYLSVNPAVKAVRTWTITYYVAGSVPVVFSAEASGS